VIVRLTLFCKNLSTVRFCGTQYSQTCLFLSCRRRHFVFLRFIYSKEASVEKSSSRIASFYQQLKFVARSKILVNVFRDGWMEEH